MKTMNIAAQIISALFVNLRNARLNKASVDMMKHIKGKLSVSVWKWHLPGVMWQSSETLLLWKYFLVTQTVIFLFWK